MFVQDVVLLNLKLIIVFTRYWDKLTTLENPIEQS